MIEWCGSRLADFSVGPFSVDPGMAGVLMAMVVDVPLAGAIGAAAPHGEALPRFDRRCSILHEERVSRRAGRTPSPMSIKREAGR
ncbi:MAG: hypothetical protein AAF683_00115 [Pseudomonadota bacterium]